MEMRPIGSTGVAITPLGFGTSALGDMPDTYGYAVSEDRARATLARLFEGPVNMIDSSRLYGFGRSEERIGAAIRANGGLPDGMVLSTKLDRDLDTGRFDAAQARKSLEESLEALGIDRIPILHLHDPEHARDLDEIRNKGGALDELFRMKEEGLVDAVGLAMGRLDIMEPLVDDWAFDVLISHNRYTIINRSADRLFSAAHARGIAIINAAPFAGGIFAKGSNATQKVSYTDMDDEGLAPVRAVEVLCADMGVEPGAAALQFSMRDPRITSTLVGVSRPERIDQNLAWAEAEIPEGFWDALAEVPFSTEDPEANRVYNAG
ncbi:aldo/keto reductase [Qingshengfaniella alkalisoli]|uniref:Aldo/keto reductase n=1 Tax=Qingshengfaniella alkalisoli TaxID=2599296 RepID=A0A5B8IZV4_9RHOB|nr:aldo/keto reductase [Qingshengfaniella alkalisoli]QDY71602.1 aldo/keto reductase [Qingshengfaniella alkalisoli]